MTLKQLEAFYWAASCRNFGLAAHRLNISVSSLSKRIAELETVVGAPLFNREGRSATLSVLGEHLLEEAGEILRRTDDFLARAVQGRSAVGRCRMGMGELTSLTWIAPFMARAHASLHGLHITPDIDLGDALQRKLADGELDCAIVADASTSGAIASQVIGETRFAWVAAPMLAGQHSHWTSDAIADCTIVTLPEGAGTTRMLDVWMNTHETRGKHILPCSNLGAVAAMLKHGLGVGFLSTAWAQAMVDLCDLAYLHAAPPLPSLSYAFQCRRDDHRPMLRALRKLAQEMLDFSAPVGLV